MNQKPDFSELLDNGFKFNLGEAISNGWRLFGKSAGNFIGFALIYLVTSYAGNFLFALIPIPFLSNIIGIVFAVIYSGIFIFCRNLTLKREEFGDFFKAFEFFGQIFLHYLVFYLMLAPLGILIFLVVLPPDFFNLFMDFDQLAFFEDPTGYMPFVHMGPVEIIGLLISFIGFIYLGLAYIFAIPLIVDAKLGFWEAMELSRKVVTKQFFSFFGFMILVGLMFTIGTIITCGLGALVMLPFISCATFVAYESVFGPYLSSSQSQIDSFGSGDDYLEGEREN